MHNDAVVFDTDGLLTTQTNPTHEVDSLKGVVDLARRCVRTATHFTSRRQRLA